MRRTHLGLLFCLLKSATETTATRKFSLLWRNQSACYCTTLFRGTPFCFAQHPEIRCGKHAFVTMAKPRRDSVVDSYQTVSVNCKKCGERLFRYKKKNGTKSNLVKCYVERICEDSAGLLAKNEQSTRGRKGFCGTAHLAIPTLHALLPSMVDLPSEW